MTKNNHYDVLIVGGFGHVGLPLGIVLADAGLRVALHDIDQTRRALIEAGQMPFFEYDAEPRLRRVIGKNLLLTTDLADVRHSDSVVITIGTPVDEHLNPQLLPFLDLAERLAPHLRPDHHIMLRSTVYPGTSQRIQDFFQKRGVPIHLSVCPERFVQGYAIRELGKLPQIVAGFTEEAVRRSRALFERLRIPTVVVTVPEAELAKLFSNAWRYIQFATANQFYMIATENGVDFSRIHHAMTHGYERAQDFPLPGFAAGPCLLKDTLQLSAFHKNNFLLGHAAMLINEGLPNFIFDTLRKSPEVDLSTARVGVLGMAFKANVDDIRDSLSYKLVKILRFHGVDTVCSDEFVQDPSFISKEELLATCRVVIVGVPHSAYKALDVPKSTLLIDPWRVARRQGEQ
jgi:UDP-N-acetyl-D-mannosaminuronic acid dehydrogenase